LLLSVLLNVQLMLYLHICLMYLFAWYPGFITTRGQSNLVGRSLSS
jgi:hypothetical protein